MLVDIPRKWNQLWDTWDIRGCIILSLSLQTFLILLAPFRKRTNSNWILVPLWSAYLLADWAANFCIGLISSRLWTPSESSSDAKENEDLLAFWAPFLLVHLGGQDNITAFALEDNELWPRHLFGLVFQCLAVVYTFVQSLPKNQLWVPTMFIFMTGTIKYAERTRSLYLASADSFKESMLPKANEGTNYAKIIDQFNWWHARKLPTRIQMVPESERAGAITINRAKRGKLTALEVVQYGYRFFETFKGLVVDMFLNRKERNKIRDFFLKRTAEDAFKVVEVELNFIYEVLYTKLPVVYGYFGAGVRVFSLASVCSAIVIFTLKSKSVFKSADVMITYCILYGALVLDLTALFLFVFSDRTIVSLWKLPLNDDEPIHYTFPTTRLRILNAVLMLMNRGTVSDSRAQTPRVLESRWSSDSRAQTPRVLESRWSESISTYNLINYCLLRRSVFVRFFFMSLRVIRFLDHIIYVKARKCNDSLKEFIFDELKSKAEYADDLEKAKEICTSRGDRVLYLEEGASALLPYVADADFDQSLIQWHIATELCYNKELYDIRESGLLNIEKYDVEQRKNAKILSDYMLYLLIMKPSMMSTIAGIGHIRFQDTCADARRYFKSTGKVRDSLYDEEQIQACLDTCADARRYIKSIGKVRDSLYDEEQIQACLDILQLSTDVPPVTVKGDESKSLLLDGCILAKKLMRLDNKWLIINKVWVEMLCYAASNARADILAAQVSKGGELLTIVWLLMAHFGLGDHFLKKESQAKAKFIVGK